MAGWALGQLILFWLAPILGAALAGGFARFIFADDEEAIVEAKKK